MKILEYKAKELFETYGIPGMPGLVVDNLDDLEGKIARAGLQYPVVVKAQVQIGGRGKAGGIQFADDAAGAAAHCTRLLKNELRGYMVNQVLIVEKVDIRKEWYLSVMLDRENKCPLIIFSAAGGMEIEEVARTRPQEVKKLPVTPSIGVQKSTSRYLLSSTGQPLDYLDAFHGVLSKLYDAFMHSNCLLCEINPLAVSEDGRIIALDGKVDIDDSALYRLPGMIEYRDAQQDEPLVKEARLHGFLYIPIEQGGSVAVASNGSGMLMSCIDLITREGMHVGAAMDLGGGATAERIQEAIRILLLTPGIKAVLINIFGGITRCDEVAGGVKLAVENGGKSLPIIVRMEGTNKKAGQEILAGIPGDIIFAEDLRASVQALLERKDIL